MSMALELDFTDRSETLYWRIAASGGANGTRVNSAGNIVAAACPRFDYDPVTRAPLGLLIEPAATNALTYASDFANAAWSKSNTNVTAAAALGPDGAMSMQKVEAATSATTTLSRTVTAAGSASGNTLSIYAKKGSGATDCNSFVLRNATTGTNLLAVTINYDTGALTWGIGSGPAAAINAGGGIWRIPLAASAGISAGDNLTVYLGFTGNPETAGEYAYLSAAQLEAGGLVTSFIPTTAAAVTRSADQLAMTGTDFSVWFNQTAGTFAFSFISPANNRYVAAVSDGSNDNRYAVAPGQFSQVSITTANALQGAIDAGDPAFGVIQRLAFAYAANDVALSYNGGAITTDTSVVLPTVNRLDIGAAVNGATPLGGHLLSIRYDNTRRSNADVIALASLVAGTGQITEGGDTVGAAGIVKIKAAATITEGEDSTAAAGEVGQPAAVPASRTVILGTSTARQVFAQAADPRDHADWKAAATGLLADDEVIETFELMLGAEAVAAGMSIDADEYRVPRLADGGKSIQFWLSIAPGMRLDPMFSGNGVTLPIEVTISSTSIPGRVFQRTIAVKVLQL